MSEQDDVRAQGAGAVHAETDPVVEVLGEAEVEEGSERPPPLPTGAPYRLARPPDPTPDFAAELRAPRARPVVGPTLSVFAVILWSYLVAGQFTTSWMSGGPMPQGLAATFVLLTTGAALVSSMRASAAASPPATRGALIGRGIGALVLAFVLFGTTVFAATVLVAMTPSNHDLLVAAGFVATSVAAAVLGGRWTWPDRPERTPRERMSRLALWGAGALCTFVAFVELAVNG
jgi:hypothetical protein